MQLLLMLTLLLELSMISAPCHSCINSSRSSEKSVNWLVLTDCYLDQTICDRLCENRPCSHLVVIRETLI